MLKDILTQHELKTHLHYHPITGVFTRLNAPQKKTGSVNKGGYLQISIKCKLYYAHRLAWLYMTGEWPKNQIDHINHEKLDNRITNLREVTNQENGRNQKPRKQSKSGAIGVSPYIREGRCDRWQAQINSSNGTPVHLGFFIRKEDAVLARKKAEVLYGFHPNHGKLLLCWQ